LTLLEAAKFATVLGTAPDGRQRTSRPAPARRMCISAWQNGAGRRTLFALKLA
jgi:hypothetical protein